MTEYRGVKIHLYESDEFRLIQGYEVDYTVTRNDGMIFQAASVYGKVFATTSEAALEGAKKLIDRANIEEFFSWQKGSCS